VKVYISADIEGVTGVVSWGQAGGPTASSFDWDFARRMMTHDVNAAIVGARAAGATEIVIKDSHNTSKNLLIDQLEEDVELISGMGAGVGGMMCGIDSSFDACFLVGYHAMAGTAGGIMEHTITGIMHGYWINGMPAGEIAMSAATAGVLGVPLVMVSSDAAGCKEAGELIPGLATAVTKTGIGRYMGRLKHPSVTEKLITEAAQDGLQAVREGKIKPWVPSEPVVAKLEFNRTEEADHVAMLPNARRVDDYSIEFTSPTWDEVHAWSRRAMSIGLSARSADAG
jgi:D-amino peptidase